MDKMKSETLEEQRDRFVRQRQLEDQGRASLAENQLLPENVILAKTDDEDGEEETQALSADVGQDRITPSSQDIPTKNMTVVKTTSSAGESKTSRRKNGAKAKEGTDPAA